LIPSSPFSPVHFADKILRITGIFCVFRRKTRGSYLQLRLAGGESAIRTFVTFFEFVSSDVDVSLQPIKKLTRESIGSRGGKFPRNSPSLIRH
jgi:hypothetical protein